MLKSLNFEWRSKFFALMVAATMAPGFPFPLHANSTGAANPADSCPVAETRKTLRPHPQPERDRTPPPSSGSKGAGWRMPSVTQLGHYLTPCFMFCLLATDPGALQTAGQGGLLSSIGLPSLNLSSSDPASMVVAQEVNYVFGKANVTGWLPPLGSINSLLAANSPSGTSILQTLPPANSASAAPPLAPAASPASTASATDPPAPASMPATLPEPGALPYAVEVPAADVAANPSAEVVAAQVSIDYGVYDAAYGYLEGIGYQLDSLSALLQPTQPLAAAALGFAGNQLLSYGYFSQGFKGSEEIVVGQRALAVAQNATQSAISATPATPEAGSNSSTTAPQGSSDALSSAIEPSIIYGRWLCEPTQTISNTTIVLKFTYNELVNTSQTAGGPNGTSLVSSQNFPGAVSAKITYRAPDDNLAANKAIGKIHVLVRIKQSNGNTLELPFVYQNASSADGKSHLDILEQDDLVYIKLP